jgi:hypothetical protein
LALGASLVLLIALAWGWMRSLFPQLRALEGTLSDVMGRAIDLMLVAALALLSISILSGMVSFDPQKGEGAKSAHKHSCSR